MFFFCKKKKKKKKKNSVKQKYSILKCNLSMLMSPIQYFVETGLIQHRNNMVCGRVTRKNPYPETHIEETTMYEYMTKIELW